MSYPRFSIVGGYGVFRVRENKPSGGVFWPGIYPTRAAAKAALKAYDARRREERRVTF